MKHRILGMATTLITAMMLIGGGAGGIAAAATPTESTPTGSKQVTDTGFNTYDLTHPPRTVPFVGRSAGRMTVPEQDSPAMWTSPRI